MGLGEIVFESERLKRTPAQSALSFHKNFNDNQSDELPSPARFSMPTSPQNFKVADRSVSALEIQSPTPGDSLVSPPETSPFQTSNQIF